MNYQNFVINTIMTRCIQQHPSLSWYLLFFALAILFGSTEEQIILCITLKCGDNSSLIIICNASYKYRPDITYYTKYYCVKQGVPQCYIHFWFCILRLFRGLEIPSGASWVDFRYIKFVIIVKWDIVKILQGWHSENYHFSSSSALMTLSLQCTCPFD